MLLVLLVVGEFIKKRVGVLSRYFIPGPIIGGLVFSLIALVGHQADWFTFQFYDTMRAFLLLVFFTTIGFSASFELLKKGGVGVALFLAAAVGLVVLQNYLHIRHVRKQLFQDLIADEDFVINPGAMAPQAFEVLQDGTGFLTPDDLAEFDQAVDEYVNGEYYCCPATAEEIVVSVTKLRETRETEIYLNVLNTVLITIEKLVDAKDPRFPPACITTEKRPWGRRSEMVNVWVVSLLAIVLYC